MKLELLPAETIGAIIKQSEAAHRTFIFIVSERKEIEKVGLEI